MTLYINCCVREESRTNRLARAVLQKLGGDITELKLYEENPKPLNRETLNKRTELIEQGDYSDPIFDYAKQFASADSIVIAAPYWDFAVCAKLRSFTTSPTPAVPTPRPTATAISRVSQKTSSVFLPHIW